MNADRPGELIKSPRENSIERKSQKGTSSLWDGLRDAIDENRRWILSFLYAFLVILIIFVKKNIPDYRVKRCFCRKEPHTAAQHAQHRKTLYFCCSCRLTEYAGRRTSPKEFSKSENSLWAWYLPSILRVSSSGCSSTARNPYHTCLCFVLRKFLWDRLPRILHACAKTLFLIGYIHVNHVPLLHSLVPLLPLRPFLESRRAQESLCLRLDTVDILKADPILSVRPALTQQQEQQSKETCINSACLQTLRNLLIGRKIYFIPVEADIGYVRADIKYRSAFFLKRDLAAYLVFKGFAVTNHSSFSPHRPAPSSLLHTLKSRVVYRRVRAMQRARGGWGVQTFEYSWSQKLRLAAAYGITARCSICACMHECSCKSWRETQRRAASAQAIIILWSAAASNALLITAACRLGFGERSRPRGVSREFLSAAEPVFCSAALCCSVEKTFAETSLLVELLATTRRHRV